jgi:hypothetical protein
MGDGDLWTNADGDVVHPNAPSGGGGAGFFRSAAPLGTNLDSTSDLPHPFSPVGRNFVPQANSEGSSLVNNQDFERLIELMEADATDADQEWKSNLSNVLFTFLEPKVLADYKTDGNDCESARVAFNFEWNEIECGRGDPKKLLAAYDIYSLRIGALQRANERIDALIAIDFAKLLGPFLDWVMRVKKFQLAQKFQRQLKRLMDDLDAAESAVTKAEVKTALNIAVSAITTIVVPEATLAKLLLAGGGMVVHIVIDQSLGEGSVKGTVVFVAGDGGEFVELSKHGKEAIENLKGGSKSIGVAAAAITAVLDVKDIYEGKDRVEEVKKELEEVRKGYEELMAGVLPMIPEFIALDRLIQSVPALLNRALVAGNDAAKNYDAVKQEIQAAIQEGQ